MLLTTFNVAMIVKIQHSTDYVIKHESDLLKRFRSTSEASTVLSNTVLSWNIRILSPSYFVNNVNVYIIR